MSIGWSESQPNRILNKGITNKHGWRVFVRVEHDELNDSDLIQSVKFTLHETFKKPERLIEQAPFELSTAGWGTFDIPIHIEWRKELKMMPSDFEHELSFDGEGETKQYILRVNKQEILDARANKKKPVGRGKKRGFSE